MQEQRINSPADQEARPRWRWGNWKNQQGCKRNRQQNFTRIQKKGNGRCRKIRRLGGFSRV